MATGFELRHHNDIDGLLWIHRFGWLRSVELGRLMWPREKYSRTRADRIIRGWLARHLVIARQLPDGARRAVALSASGARLLQAAGNTSAFSGKDWGKTDGTRWSPDHAWRHDLMAAGVLTLLFEDGYTILPEKSLRRENPRLPKIPDGLAWKEGCVIWLEVESARKTGKAMSELASAIDIVASGQSRHVSGHRPNIAMVAYADAAQDERGHGLNHRQRLIAALQKTARQDVELCWAQSQLVGCGVAKVTLTTERVIADRASRILKVLDAGGWRPDANGCFVATYGPVKAVVWEDEAMGWSYMLEGDGVAESACQANTKSAAMRGCASLLAGR